MEWLVGLVIIALAIALIYLGATGKFGTFISAIGASPKAAA